MIVQIYSHAHSPPLSPPADLKYDPRKTPNPPVQMRQQYDGQSKRLRKEMLHDNSFIKLLEQAKAEIQAAVTALLEIQQAHSSDPESDGLSPLQGNSGREKLPGDISTVPVEDILMGGNISDRQDGDGSESCSRKHQDHDSPSVEDDQSSASDAESVEDVPGDDGPLLRVSCFCERGVHRSVAFAEELAAQDWPKGWMIEVAHRDVDQRPAKSSQRKKGRRAVVGADMND